MKPSNLKLLLALAAAVALAAMLADTRSYDRHAEPTPPLARILTLLSGG